MRKRDWIKAPTDKISENAHTYTSQNTIGRLGAGGRKGANMIKQQDADEIEALYRDAKNKRNQIDIIAELYPTYCKEEVKELLRDRGYTIPWDRKRKKQEVESVEKTTKAAGQEKAAGLSSDAKEAAVRVHIPESVLEAVRNQIVEVSNVIDDYQTKIAELNNAMMQQQDKLQELDGFLKTYKG